MKSSGHFAIPVDGHAEECSVLFSDRDPRSVFSIGPIYAKDFTHSFDEKEWADEQWRAGDPVQSGREGENG